MVTHTNGFINNRCGGDCKVCCCVSSIKVLLSLNWFSFFCRHRTFQVVWYGKLVSQHPHELNCNYAIWTKFSFSSEKSENRHKCRFILESSVWTNALHSSAHTNSCKQFLFISAEFLLVPNKINYFIQVDTTCLLIKWRKINAIRLAQRHFGLVWFCFTFELTGQIDDINIEGIWVYSCGNWPCFASRIKWTENCKQHTSLRAHFNWMVLSSFNTQTMIIIYSQNITIREKGTLESNQTHTHTQTSTRTNTSWFLSLFPFTKMVYSTKPNPWLQ